jgi:hypothetical protein
MASITVIDGLDSYRLFDNSKDILFFESELGRNISKDDIHTYDLGHFNTYYEAFLIDEIIILLDLFREYGVEQLNRIGKAYDFPSYSSMNAFKEAIEDDFIGEYSSLEEYGEERYGEKIPEFIQYYIDWESFVRDLQNNGEILIIDGGFSYLIFEYNS